VFGFGKVAGATSLVTQAIQQMLAPFNISGGLPIGFWRDPYVIGYLQSTIGMLAKLASEGTLAGEKIGQVNLNVFNNLVPGQGLQVLRMANEFYTEKNLDYLDGMDKGSMAVLVIYGSRDFDTHVDVEKARMMAEQTMMDLGQQTAPAGAAEVGSMLQFLLFNTVVADRLGRAE
jgi:hypothetical protein